MPSKLVVVTVNYASADAILEGLDQTVTQLRAFDSARLWIVDNQSPDNSATVLRKMIAAQGWGEVVEVIDAGANGGFGAGNNVAIRRAMAEDSPPDYIYFLNPDAIPAPGSIAALTSFLDATPTAGIVGGLLEGEDGMVQDSLFRFPSFWSEVERALSLTAVRKLLEHYRAAIETPTAPIRVDWVSGASFVARLTALRDTDLFDERFFLYWEEIELCHRIAAAGYEIWCTPDARVMHSGGVSTGMQKPEKRIPPYWFASRNHFFRTTGRGGNMTILNLAVTASLAVQRVHRKLRGKPLTPPHYLRDFVRYSFGKTSDHGRG